MIKYHQAVLKYEDNQRCVEITAGTKARGKDCAVSVVYTFDEWKTVRNKTGSFAGSKDKDNLYRICIPINAILNVKMWFSLKLTIYNSTTTTTNNNTPLCEEIWDNNNGWNYEIFTEKLPKICLPSPQKPTTTNNTSNTNNPSNNNQPTSSITKIDKPQPAPHPVDKLPQPPAPSVSSVPPTSNVHNSVFIINLDYNNNNNTLTSRNNNNNNLNTNEMDDRIISKPLNSNLPLIMFSSKMRSSPFSFIMPPDYNNKRSDMLISKEMRGVYNPYVF